MERKQAVVVGALGVIGRALVSRLTAQEDWDVVGLSRRRPEEGTGARHVSVDLLDRADAETTLAELTGATLMFYAAYQAPPTLAEEVEPNLTMLRNAVETIDAVAPGLAHVNLMQGGKAYGCHLGAFKTPARESDLRHIRRTSTTTRRTGCARRRRSGRGRGRRCAPRRSAGSRLATG